MSGQHLFFFKFFFFNKKDNLVYGKHLKELIKRGVAMKILFYKVPSEDLYKTVISDDKFENQTSWKLLLI